MKCNNNSSNDNDNDSFYFLLKFHFDIYKLNIQMQISPIIGNLYSVNLITGISSIKKIE